MTGERLQDHSSRGLSLISLISFLTVHITIYDYF